MASRRMVGRHCAGIVRGTVPETDVIEDCTVMRYTSDTCGKQPGDPANGITYSGLPVVEHKPCAVDTAVIPMYSFNTRTVPSTGGMWSCSVSEKFEANAELLPGKIPLFLLDESAEFLEEEISFTASSFEPLSSFNAPEIWMANRRTTSLYLLKCGYEFYGNHSLVCSCPMVEQ